MPERLIAGATAPDFTLKNAEGQDVSLRDFRGRNTVIYFYPAASTPGCTKQACDFRDSLGSLQHAGYDVVGISPDPVGKLATFAAAEGLTFPLLSDEDHSVAEAYAAWGEKKNYGKTYQGLIRSTIVVDRRRPGCRRAVQRPGHRACRQTSPGPETRAVVPTGSRYNGAWRPPPGFFPGTTTAPRASGEIGRHAGFRFLCLRAWGFKSPLAHTERTPVFGPGFSCVSGGFSGDFPEF